MKLDEGFGGFAWAVPKAFGAAVHACRFEQGDVLYSDPSAYDESRAAKPPKGHHIQVLDPPRTTRALSGDGEGQRFFSNWESPVDFEWMDYKEKNRVEMRSSQGGLFTCLWKGDLEALRADRVSELPRPLLLRDLQSQLAECVGPMLGQFKRGRSGKTKKRRASGPGQLFVCAIDQSSDTSRIKGESILRALDAHFPVERRDCSPGDLALPEANRFHPALEILGIAIASRDSAKLEGVLREVLYAGGKAAGQEGGRFQLARHGTLVEIP